MIEEVFIDIETIPSQEGWVREHVAGGVKPPGNIKKQDSIDTWMEEKYDAAVDVALDKTGLKGATNHIISISWAVGDGEIFQVGTDGDLSQEAYVTQTFFNRIKTLNMGTTFIGHNVANFDIKVIKQRAMILGVPIPVVFPSKAKPWDTSLYDTMLQWDAKDFVSMDLLAKAMGIEGKGDMSGSDVYQYWKDGRYEEIAEYNKEDVRMVREIYNRMNFKGEV